MATAQTHTLLQAALAYAAKGWHVFPCHTPTAEGCSCRRDCGRDCGKHPRTRRGLNDATTDEGQIRRWWKMWPAANVAIRTGAISGLVVLDVDPDTGGRDSLYDLEQSYQPLPQTPLSLTGGGGEHYAFGHPGRPVPNSVSTLGAGLDIRGDGGYIIAPPSLHMSGKRYTWDVAHEPDETALAPLPDWLLALCQEPARQEHRDAGAFIPNHQRNDTLFRMGSSMRARGFTETVILAALREMNATQCEPPGLSDAELRKIVGSIAKYEAGPSQEERHQQRHGQTQGSEPTPAPTLITRCAADVTPEPVEWLWDPYIALGTLCMLDGDPGIGKSLLMLQLAANISQGHPFPDQTGKPTLGTTAPANVLIMTREDSLSMTIRPRLDASGADVQRVFVSANWLDAQGQEQAFTLKHLPLLEAELKRLSPRLVVLDPIQSFFGDIDMHRANQTRPLLDGLAALAEKYRCAIVCIRHPGPVRTKLSPAAK